MAGRRRGRAPLTLGTRSQATPKPSKHQRRASSPGDGPRGKRRRLDNVSSAAPRPNANRERAPRVTSDQDSDDSDEDEGGDSEGNEWRLGFVDSNDDSDIDSDQAMGASDEERFEGFAFRGSSSKAKRGPRRKTNNARGNEADEVREGGVVVAAPPSSHTSSMSGFDDDEALESDAIDLAEALDESMSDEDIVTPAPGMSESLEGSLKHMSAIADAPGDGGNDDDDDDDDDDDEFDPPSEDELAVADDSVKLDTLHDLAASMQPPDSTGPSRRQAWGGALEGAAPSDYQVTASKKLTVADMLPSVTDARMKESLRLLSSERGSKPSYKATGIPDKLPVPLAKRQQDRLNRGAAYAKSKETLDRWIETVKHNRRAEHLSFPLVDPAVTAAKGSNRVLPSMSMSPQTDLEGTIRKVLEESGLKTSNGDEERRIQAFEALQANKMPLEEVQARRARLRMARELLFREELRSKRIKKIKSKTYRRIHRRQREFAEKDTKAALAAGGVEFSDDEQEIHDRRRAEERMGSRHKDSKWATAMKSIGRATWDEDSRSAMADMARRREELSKRIEGQSSKRRADDDEYLVSSDASSEHERSDVEASSDDPRKQAVRGLNRIGNSLQTEKIGMTSTSGLGSMKFISRAEAARKVENDDAIESLRRDFAGADDLDTPEEAAVVGRRKYGPSTKASVSRLPGSKTQSNEFEEPLHSDAADSRQEETSRGAQAVLDGDQRQSTGNANPLEDRPISVRTLDNTQGLQKSSQPLSMNFTRPEVDELAQERQDRHPAKGNIRAKRGPNVTATAPQTKKRANDLTGTTSPSQKMFAVEENYDSSTDRSGSEQPPTPPNVSQQELRLRAFAGDEDMQDFQAEKQQIVQEEDDQVVDNTLEGWGSWTGMGLRKSERASRKGRFLTKVEGVKPEKRKDAKMSRAIINEKRVKKNAKYLASTLPHPFETRQQYERSLRLPVGPEWTTKETFQSATKPRVLLKRGVIAPMEKPQV
ncbi:MAG: hypothetical protein M1833_004437 [Piccolia ochrophora]|nr:MAG: hypothetical protein M1833_004437 [Piccolia ochrophora]